MYYKIFCSANNSVECAPLSLNLSYIVIGLPPFSIPSDRYLVFTVKVFELDGWQKSFKSTKGVKLAAGTRAE
jgi:hypothetical protein